MHANLCEWKMIAQISYFFKELNNSVEKNAEQDAIGFQNKNQKSSQEIKTPTEHVN